MRAFLSECETDGEACFTVNPVFDIFFVWKRNLGKILLNIFSGRFPM